MLTLHHFLYTTCPHVASIVHQAASSKASGSRGLDLPKLEDAHWAGTDRAGSCSLILTEGDSAKALAVSGLEVTGRESFGVLPLRGKILNVSEVTPKQLLQNTELVALCRTLGLDFNKSYEHDLDGLRYGRVLLMCDQVLQYRRCRQQLSAASLLTLLLLLFSAPFSTFTHTLPPYGIRIWMAVTSKALS
jgi:hypothetical protein